MLKVECDMCGRITELAESYGPNISGESAKPYIYDTPECSLKIESLNHQVCGGCLGHTLSRLLNERWPFVVIHPEREGTDPDVHPVPPEWVSEGASSDDVGPDDDAADAPVHRPGGSTGAD